MNKVMLKDKNLYYIGGIVRDMILNKESFDIDITYVGNAIEYGTTIYRSYLTLMTNFERMKTYG